MTSWNVAACLVALTVGGGSWASSSERVGTGLAQAPVSRPPVQFYVDPKPLADFATTTIDGQPFRSVDLRGKVLLINFWATWCPPCVTEVPDLVRLQAKYDGRLVVLGISDDHGQVDIVKTFAAAKQVNYPLVMNTRALAASFPGLLGLPTTYVVDQQGRIVQRHVGQLNMARTEAEVQALLALSGAGSGKPGGL
ncbi:MAG: TlpA family protein disulfide reductase [Vicinamibacterales bacterium]